ncbi:hypothetical protein N4R57_16995 [Rhodobacteraceae bacterium D3-12]|nr:hypothetical protein N4R57_16995 [Rhodobacteraceae bacterium D3-12]
MADFAANSFEEFGQFSFEENWLRDGRRGGRQKILGGFFTVSLKETDTGGGNGA